MFDLEDLLLYEEHLNVAMQLLQENHPHNEVIDTLEELTKRFGEEIEERRKKGEHL